MICAENSFPMLNVRILVLGSTSTRYRNAVTQKLMPIALVRRVGRSVTPLFFQENFDKKGATNLRVCTVNASYGINT